MFHLSLTPEFARFRWGHMCSLATRTLSVVLQLQGASIRILNFGDYTGNWRPADLAELKTGGLTVLGIAALRTKSMWPMELLARNYRTLRHLRLGNEVNLAVDYASDGYVDCEEFYRSKRTKKFAKLMKKRLANLEEASTPVVRLKSLSLIGLDLLPFAKGLIEPVIDFNSLGVLEMESCAGLEAAFRTLIGSRAGSHEAKNALGLHTLKIRHENTSDEFLRSLETFLLTLKPLTHLHVLLEGYYGRVFKLQKVLQIHGTCLQSFIWDERTEPRDDVRYVTAVFEDPYENLGLVAKHCLELKALGISIDWEQIIESERSHDWVRAAVAVLGCAPNFMLISLSLLIDSLS